MRLQFLGLAVVTGISVAACSSGGGGPAFIPSGTGGSTGLAGAAGPAGANGAAGSTGTAGASGAAGTPGTAGGGVGGSTGAAGVDGGAGGSDGGATGGTGGGTLGANLTKVIPSAGCGMAPGQAVGSLVMHTIQTMGTMLAGCADANCSATKPTPWSYARDYWVRLPTGYDNTKAYPLVFEGPGCSGQGNNLYNIPIFDATVIRVGLSPSKDAEVYHATNPGQGCFDDKNDDSSVDWPFYETLYDHLASTLCFDRNRVFAGGNSSGAWFSNELGCKYAGDPTRPVRGIMPNTGGLPTDPKYVPTCTTKPMAGFWSHEVGDTTNPFSGNIVAMNRALQVNGCTVSAGVTETYDNATTASNFTPFPVGTDMTSCKRYKGCPDLTPMVVCPLPGNNHADHASVVDPGWPAFLSLFSTGDLITQ
jgi:poly(3-hydroxybutyrate) depolymerase